MADIPSGSEAPFALKEVHFAYEVPKATSENLLLPDEAQLIAYSTSPERRQLFTAGRIAARRALKLLNPELAPQPVLRGDSNEPLFPSGIRGSISHCDHLACAVVTTHSRYAGLGIDIEARNRVINSKVVQRILSTAEKAFYGALPAEEKEIWVRVFCAKEAIFKACFSYILREFSFEDIDILFSSPQEAKIHPSPGLSSKLSEKLPRSWRMELEMRELKGKIIAIAGLVTN